MTEPRVAIRRIQVSGADAGARIDRLLTATLGDLSRERVKTLLTTGCVDLVDDARARPMSDPSHRVRAGERFIVRIPPPVKAEPEGQDIPLTVVFEDDHLIVIDKPSGLVVHPAPGNPDRTLVNALIAHCGDSLSGIGGVMRPGIVHRLDKDTSGLIVAAKSDAAHRGLAAQFARRSASRAYQAVIWGSISPVDGMIEGAIGRNPRDRKKMAVVARGGKPAITRYRTRKRFSDVATHIQCQLETGRTHQIRVHVAHVGHPILGDPLYARSRKTRLDSLPVDLGEAIRALRGQALHAGHLGFEHPVTAEILKFDATLPNDMRRLIALLERL